MTVCFNMDVREKVKKGHRNKTWILVLQKCVWQPTVQM